MDFDLGEVVRHVNWEGYLWEVLDPLPRPDEHDSGEPSILVRTHTVDPLKARYTHPVEPGKPWTANLIYLRKVDGEVAMKDLDVGPDDGL